MALGAKTTYQDFLNFFKGLTFKINNICQNATEVRADISVCFPRFDSRFLSYQFP